MRPFFLVGNKRSGTTLFGRLLNLHPQIFCSRESDAAWILHQMARKPYIDPECRDPHSPAWVPSHPRDDDFGLRSTQDAAADLFRDGRRDPQATFERVQRYLMVNGSRVQNMVYTDKPEVEALGDQKPVQHADPDVRHWLDWRFPEAKYLHMVRHPAHCITSMREMAFMPWWSGPLEDVERLWAEHERWSLQIPEHRRMTVRYEDFVERPVVVMAEVFEFLGFDMPDSVRRPLRGAVQQRESRTLVQLPYSDDLLKVMDRYGYTPLTPRGSRLPLSRDPRTPPSAHRAPVTAPR